MNLKQTAKTGDSSLLTLFQNEWVNLFTTPKTSR